MTGSETVTVCVPVYNGAAFVAQTLDSILGQRHAALRVLISIDRGTDDSERICRRFERDSRVEIIVQARRLGWVGNTNAALARVQTPFACITPHDDLLAPEYVGTMVDALRRDPSAVCAYSDIEMFGARRGPFSQPPVHGDALTRALDVLLNHYSSVAYRAVVRADERGIPLLPVGIPDDFAADTAWLMSLAVRGSLLRVPQLLYRKRYDPSTVHAGWSRWGAAEAGQRFTALVACLTRIALDGVPSGAGVTGDRAVRDAILAAALLRVGGFAAGGWGTPTTPLETVIATQRLQSLLHDRGPFPRLDVALDPATAHPLLIAAISNHLAGPSMLARADESRFTARVARGIARRALRLLGMGDRATPAV